MTMSGQTTPTSSLHPRPTQMGPFLAISVAGHVVVVVLFLVLSWVLSGPRINLEQTPIKASLVRLGKPRDDKLLPRKDEPPAPPTPPEPTPTPAPPAPVSAAAPVPIPTKETKPSESKTKPSIEAPKKNLADVFNKVGRAGKAEEAEGALDGDVDGDSAKQEGERYFGLLTAVIKRNFDVSDTIPEAERRTLRAEVAVRIGASGELLDVDITKSSGNELFDSAVIGAVKKAAPFTPPPEHLRADLKRGQVLGFTP